MTLQEFINQWSGKTLDFDGAYGGQCVDVAKAWCANLGITGLRGNAVDWKNNTRENLIWIGNTPTGVPQPGDLIVWGTGIGQYGHIAIFVEGDTNSFRSFDQNYPIGSTCHIQSHNYNNVLGWLHPTMLDASLEKDAVQFEGDSKIYFWAQSPEIAIQWYGTDWPQFVRTIKPEVRYVDKPVIQEVIKEVEKVVEVQIPKEIIQTIIEQVPVSQPLPEDEQVVLDIYRRIKTFIKRTK